MSNARTELLLNRVQKFLDTNPVKTDEARYLVLQLQRLLTPPEPNYCVHCGENEYGKGDDACSWCYMIAKHTAAEAVEAFNRPALSGDGPTEPYIRALWKVVGDFSFHDDECPATTRDGDACDCGYRDAMAAIHEARKALRPETRAEAVARIEVDLGIAGDAPRDEPTPAHEWFCECEHSREDHADDGTCNVVRSGRGCVCDNPTALRAASPQGGPTPNYDAEEGYDQGVDPR